MVNVNHRVHLNESVRQDFLMDFVGRMYNFSLKLIKKKYASQKRNTQVFKVKKQLCIITTRKIKETLSTRI